MSWGRSFVMALEVAVATLTAYLGFHNLLVWQRFREPIRFWTAVYAFSWAPIPLAGAILVAPAASDPVREWAWFVVQLGAFSLVPGAIVAREFANRRMPVWPIAVMASFPVVRIALILSGNLVFRWGFTDDGRPLFGPLAVPTAAVYGFVFVYLVVAYSRGPDRTERIVMLSCLSATILLSFPIVAFTELTMSLFAVIPPVPVVMGLHIILLLRVYDLYGRIQNEAGLQQAIADLGRYALESTDIGAVLAHTVAVARSHLGTTRCRLEPVNLMAEAGPGISVSSRTDGSGNPTRVEAVVCGRREAWGVLVAERDPGFSPGETGFVEAVASVASDAVDRHEAEEDRLYQAQHDHLTGLPNRVLLRDRLGHALERCAREGHWVGVLFCDLDRFKDVNDTYGHETGDRLLIELSGRLSKRARISDTVCRFGGDEFVIVCESMPDPTEAGKMAQRVLETVREPIEIEGTPITMSASIGVVAGDPGDTPEALLRDADTAMYRAKELGGDRAELFDSALRERLLERLEMERLIVRAVRQGELVLYFQPVVGLHSGTVEAAEVLVRWHHPIRGLLAPGAFLGAAERGGVLADLDRHVIDAACSQLSSWINADAAFASLRIGVNVSAELLGDPDFEGFVSSVLDRNGLAGRSLCLELTEHAALGDPVVAGGALDGLRARGVGVSIDDFGTGYSAFSYLASLPLDEIKIDRAFVSALDDLQTEAIVETIILVGHSLGLRVVAEGVETEVQLAAVRRQGCDVAQGYFWLFCPIRGWGLGG